MKLKEIASGIATHLKRFEADPKINVQGAGGHKKYFGARTYVGGSRVFVYTVSYQGAKSLTKHQAEGYLKWLDAGNVGTYWKFEAQSVANLAHLV